jgi:NAD(P)-dependent dehydrogenase (short-subunit alcohol dehydrogenase family)
VRPLGVIDQRAVAQTAVCFDLETAHLLLKQGTAVVLVGDDGEALGHAAAALRKMGRIAIFVGNPADRSTIDAARAMAAEQFGDDPVIVTSAEFARSLDPPVK